MRSTPAYGHRASSSMKFKNISPILQSPIYVPGSTAFRYVSTVGRLNQGGQTAVFKPGLVAIYTILMSSYPLGTSKNKVTESTSFSSFVI